LARQFRAAQLSSFEHRNPDAHDSVVGGQAADQNNQLESDNARGVVKWFNPTTKI
jgi:hypothetical protein